MDSALLVMDVQRDIVDRFCDDTSLLDRLANAIDAARKHDVAVIFVRLAFRPNGIDVSPANQGFAPRIGHGGMALDDEGTTIHPALALRPTDPVVLKKRASAFTGSDLEVLLRSLGVGHLVLAGIATSGVVLSTLREAADRDYRLMVLSDGCADLDEEVHRVLMHKVFPTQAEVLTVDEWMKELAEERDALTSTTP